MEKLVDLIRKLFGVKRDVDTIMSPITKIVRDLQKHAEEERRRSDLAAQRAKEELEKSSSHENESTRAEATAKRFGDFAKV